MSLAQSLPPESLRVLVFEDNAMDATLIRRFLEANGFKGKNILTTDTLPSAMDILCKERVDICLTDYYLAANTGFDLMDEAKRCEINVPFIMLTAMEDPSLDDGALSRGAYDFIVKGEMTVEGLERTIRYTLARHSHEQELTRAALFDPLSNLYNRKAVLDKLTEAIMTDPEEGQSLGAMVHINLNGLKFINEAYGIKVGDAILRETGRRLKSLKWPGENTGRLGSDECTCIVEQLSDLGEAMIVARRIATVFSHPVRTFDGEHEISAAIGVVTFPRGNADEQSASKRIKAVDVLQQASEAMAQAKLTCRITRATEISSLRPN